MATTDARLFKITGTWKVKTKYGTRTTASNTLSHYKYGLRAGHIKVYATNEDATDGWTDVTEEFKGYLLRG